LALLGHFSAATHAASISYGTFGPVGGIVFTSPPAGGVTESSGTDAIPLYGPPSAFALGLNFAPLAFSSSASNGSADITDGQLNFTVMGTGLTGVTAISLSEIGDYTLVGAGTPGTGVLAGALMRATVTEINNAPVAPINLVPVNASFSDSLPGAIITAPWSLGLLLDVGAQLGLPAGSAATKVEIAINNALASTSEPGTAAFIAKKDFRIDVSTVKIVPEPGMAGIAGLALCGLVGASRRRR
jgi:hypothetical protein